MSSAPLVNVLGFSQAQRVALAVTKQRLHGIAVGDWIAPADLAHVDAIARRRQQKEEFHKQHKQRVNCCQQSTTSRVRTTK